MNAQVTRMQRVIVELPYVDDIEINVAYIRACMRGCLLKSKSQHASHALYT
jgi:hypothetical protein